MTNNKKLITIQKAFKLRANKIAEICRCSSASTVYNWRAEGSSRFRKMPASAWALLERYLIDECLVKDQADLNRLLVEYSEQVITEDD